jgi:CO/xanthine dehydrogenase FAD-binding subunit
MLLNLLEYHWAEHIDDALILLSRLDTRTVPLAGGTYLVGLNDDTIQAVVDLRDLELAYISEDARGVHIGAMTTLQSMVDSPVLKDLATGILSRAARASSFSRLIRNSATLGGTLGAWTASQADLLTALAALDAEVLLRSGAKTQVNLSGGTPDHPGLALPGVIFKGKQERRVPFTSLNLERRPHELIIEVLIPPSAQSSGGSFMRVGRTQTDIALLNAAATVEVKDGVYQRVRLALGGINMEPVRLQSVERQLQGQPAAAQSIMPALEAGWQEFQPPSDFRASSGYRRASGMNLAYRVLEEATNVARWRGMVSSEGGM